MKNKSVSSATSIKCKFSNMVHKILEPNYEMKRSKRWRKRNTLTDKEKLVMFEQVMKVYKECSEELTNCLYNNHQRNVIRRLRLERGYVSKKKTSKELHQLNHE